MRPRRSEYGLLLVALVALVLAALVAAKAWGQAPPIFADGFERGLNPWRDDIGHRLLARGHTRSIWLGYTDADPGHKRLMSGTPLDLNERAFVSVRYAYHDHVFGSLTGERCSGTDVVGPTGVGSVSACVAACLGFPDGYHIDDVDSYDLAYIGAWPNNPSKNACDFYAGQCGCLDASTGATAQRVEPK